MYFLYSVQSSLPASFGIFLDGNQSHSLSDHFLSVTNMRRLDLKTITKIIYFLYSLPCLSLGFSLMAIRADYEIITLHNSASLPLSDGLFDFLDDNIFV